MIDFHLRRFIEALEKMETVETISRLRGKDEYPFPEWISFINKNLAAVQKEVNNLNMKTAIYRIDEIKHNFSTAGSASFDVLVQEISELRKAIKLNSRDEYFHHYQKDRLTYLHRINDDWGSVFQNFKSAKLEIVSGVDCYALGHNTACVFHMCRVCEIGLRAIAKERGIKTLKKRGVLVPVEWGTWGEVFQRLDPAIEEIRKKPRGEKKDAALSFYETIRADLKAIQSLYRDQTMHLRGNYEDSEAQSAMFRVRELMTTLASKLDETSIKKIAWSGW